MNFAQSPHNRAQAQYEKALGEAKASNSDAREKQRQSIEDSLVEGGIDAINEYEQAIDERALNASCLAQYDGISMAREIIRRAKARI